MSSPDRMIGAQRVVSTGSNRNWEKGRSFGASPVERSEGVGGFFTSITVHALPVSVGPILLVSSSPAYADSRVERGLCSSRGQLDPYNPSLLSVSIDFPRC